MSDIFISYSRKDQVFVRKLNDALEENQRDVWVDWDDIPFSADWWAEIQAAIESADNFVIIISPDSLASEVVAKEIEAAIEYDKRIVPILHREVNAADVPPKIASLNWLFFRESDDFETSFEALIRTLDTDLAWVKVHTRLTRRAAEWVKRGRNASLLLRGDDLVEAEQCLAQTHKEPALTELHGDYILASRRAMTKQQRLVIGAVTVGLIISIFLALLAYRNATIARANEQLAWEAVATAQIAEVRERTAKETAQANEQLAWEAVATAEAAKETAQANEQLAYQAVATAEAETLRAATAEAVALLERDRAEMEYISTFSRKLAAEALANLESDPELSVLLALHSLSVTYTAEAETVLRQALQATDTAYTATAQQLDLSELQALAEGNITRQLTSEECQKYLHQDCP